MAKEKVLVIDDEEGIREALEEFFTDEGYEVTLAETGTKALEIFSGTNFNLVITDIKMPGIDGIETLRRMKKEKPEIKVIVMSGLADEETFERAIAVSAGSVEAFVPKPFKPRDLREALSAVKGGKSLPAFGLTQKQIEALNAIGKTGAVEASAALGQLTHRKLNLAASEVTIRTLARDLAEDEEKCVGVLLRCSGEVTGAMTVTLSWESGLKLIDMLEERAPGETKDYEGKSYPVLQAAGNVLAASYLNAVGKSLGLKASAAVLGVEFGSEASILKKAGGKSADGPVFIIGTEMEIPGSGVRAKVSLLPDTDSLKKIFRQAGAFQPI